MILLPATQGWACVALASLELSASAVQPGEEVAFSGSFYHDGAPVVVRWGSVDGRVLTTVTPESLVDVGHAHWRSINGRFTVPTDAAPGAHVIVATQEAAPGRPTWGVPSRAVVVIGGPSPPPPSGPPGAFLDSLSGLRLADGNRVAAPVVAGVGLVAFVLTFAAGAAAFRGRTPRRRPGPP